MATDRSTVNGIKYDKEKLRLDLLPVDALEELARVYTMGAKKYGDRNWEQGLSYMRVVGALLRHLFAWIRGETYDKEDGQRHLASVVWNALALLTYEVRGMWKFDDRPSTIKMEQAIEEELRGFEKEQV